MVEVRTEVILERGDCKGARRASGMLERFCFLTWLLVTLVCSLFEILWCCTCMICALFCVYVIYKRKNDADPHLLTWNMGRCSGPITERICIPLWYIPFMLSCRYQARSTYMQRKSL